MHSNPVSITGYSVKRMTVEVVNNAGSVGEQAHIDEQLEDALNRLMQVNVVGPMLCAKHAVWAVSTAHGGHGGSIVTIAALAAQAPRGRLGGLVPYEASKGAVVTFARGLSSEVASEGIRSNSVSPGIIETAMSASNPGIRDFTVQQSPLGRIGQPEEIAATVSRLISPEASYVTGSDIAVTGGL